MHWEEGVFHPPVFGIWTWEIERDICFADPITSSYFGMTAEEGSVGRPLKTYLRAIHQSDRKRVKSAISRAVERGTQFNEEYRVATLGGDTRKVMACGQCFRDHNGYPATYPGYIVDLTDLDSDEKSPWHQIDDLILASVEKARRARMPMLVYLLEMAHLEFVSGKLRFGNPRGSH